MMKKRGQERRGNFVVIDGLDGIGKGEAERAIVGYEQKLGRAVFDTVAFSRAESKGLPELIDFWNPPARHYHTIITAEPTYEGIGKVIRDQLINKDNDGEYTPEELIQSYAINRHVLMRRVVIPAIENGINVIQSRCFAASCTYEPLKAWFEAKATGKPKKECDAIEKRMRNLVMRQRGNQLQLERAPGLLIIPTIKDVSEVIQRIEARKATRKDDKSVFDNIEFQTALKERYSSNWLRELFESHGTKVVYLDAGISEEETRRQAVEIYKNFLDELRTPIGSK
jgi:thymidylate kinase